MGEKTKREPKKPAKTTAKAKPELLMKKEKKGKGKGGGCGSAV